MNERDQHLICRLPDCFMNPCGNEICEETMDSFKCLSAPGYTGKHSEFALGAKMFVTPYTLDNDDSPGLFVADLQEELRFSSIPATREPSNIAYDSQQKKIYWTDKDVHKVFRANASGGTQREEVSYENNDRSHISIAESLGLLFIGYLSGKKVTTTDIKPGNTFPQTETDFKTGLEAGLSSMAVDEGEGYVL
ncbi:uncharacterized protein LOC129271512 [Lytechinus pictus]|uniref:uncharacterized protein LOC129271512 n=1 Tax=Lytechinus pictus TaxID=7653 RepID=UPI0030B9EBF2